MLALRESVLLARAAVIECVDDDSSWNPVLLRR